ncbi:MAG: outer membrane lipoprotein carrier protein LolA [Hyphomonadaceae bacterium]|nr:outer membrane lipoprotein carrier protein LolA [Hyphomonadaceae bacterium]
MLSSFIALAAGMIGGVEPSPAPAVVVPAPAPIIQVAAPAAANDTQVLVTKTPEANPGTVVEAQAPDTETEVTTGSDAPIALNSQETESAPSARDTVGQSSAGPDPSVVSPNQRRAILKEASNALARTRTAEGHFVQIDQNGALSEGRFYLQRPGRMRFEYDDPVPILIAADGVTVAMQDRELETVDRVPLGATPLGLLLSNDVDFETDAEVLRVQRANGLVAITVIDPTEEADGELTMLFHTGTYDLIGWRVLDANNGITSVQLDDVRTGMTLNPRLFIIEDAEDEDDEDRR